MNTYGYEIPAAVLSAYPTALNFVPTASIAGDSFLVTAPLLLDRYPAAFATITAQSTALTELEYRALLASSDFTAAETDGRQDGYKVLADDAVRAVRISYARDLPYQAQAYELKEADAIAWDGTGDVPASIQAVADRFRLTATQARDLLIANGQGWRSALRQTELLREELYAAADAGDWAACDSLLSDLLAMML